MNYRVYVEKKKGFQVESLSLMNDLNNNLGLNLKGLRIINVYDLFGFKKSLVEKAKYRVFGEISTDTVFDTLSLDNLKYIAIEYLPGQFDQRADAAISCIHLISPEAKIKVKKEKRVSIRIANDK